MVAEGDVARKPDAPCAGGCGTLLWGGGTSLPDGERMCRPCRKRLDMPCNTAGAAQRGQGKWAGRKGRAWQTLRAQVIAEESECFRCGLEVDKTLPPRGRMSASVDHVVDLAAGGAPLDRANVRLSHHGCNGRAGAHARHGTEVRSMDLVNEVTSGDRRRALGAIRDKLAAELSIAEGRDAAALAKELRAVLDALGTGSTAGTDKGVAGVADLAAFAATRSAKSAG